MAAALLAAGASIDAASTQAFRHPSPHPHVGDLYPRGTTFLHLHSICSSIYHKRETCRGLDLALASGADVAAVDGTGRTPLHLAAGSHVATQALMQARVDAELQRQQRAAAGAARPGSGASSANSNAPWR